MHESALPRAALCAKSVLILGVVFALSQVSIGSSAMPVTNDVQKLISRISSLEQRQQQLEQAISQMQVRLRLPTTVVVPEINGAADPGVANLQNARVSGPSQPAAPSGGGQPAGAQPATSQAAGQNNNSAPARVTAPFQVVDGRGRVVFQVTAGTSSNAAVIFNPAGAMAADMIGAAEGGSLHANDSGGPNSGSYTVMAATPQLFGVAIRQANGIRARLATTDTSGAAVTLYGGDESHPVATLGQGNGGGELEVYDGSGASVAQIAAQDGGGEFKVSKTGQATTYVATAATTKGIGVMVRQSGKANIFVGAAANGGIVRVYNASRENPVAAIATSDKGSGLVGVLSGTQYVAFLTESSNAGGGNVTTTDPGGKGVFSAGYDGGTDGAACVDRKQHLHCLGISLPMSGN